MRIFIRGFEFLLEISVESFLLKFLTKKSLINSKWHRYGTIFFCFKNGNNRIFIEVWKLSRFASFKNSKSFLWASSAAAFLSNHDHLTINFRLLIGSLIAYQARLLFNRIFHLRQTLFSFQPVRTRVRWALVSRFLDQKTLLVEFKAQKW